jgi:hypothetical protein
MKDAKQFFWDFTDNELLRRQIFEEMNLLIDGEALEPWQAGQKAAFALGYDIPDDVAKTIIVRVRGLSEDELKEFSEDEVKSIVSGESHLPACNC